MSLSSKKKLSGGFSLIELLVSIGIMVVILGVVVLNQRSYTEASTLTNLADDIAVTLAQAQAYGIAVKEFAPGSSEFSAAYGVTLSILSSGSNSAYLFFADRNNNQYYDHSWSCTTGGSSECLERVNFLGNNYIEEFCVVRTSGADQCNSASRVDITFKRPETEAIIKFFNSGGQQFNPSNVKGARIVLQSPGGLTRSVVVYTTGHVSVE